MLLLWSEADTAGAATVGATAIITTTGAATFEPDNFSANPALDMADECALLLLSDDSTLLSSLEDINKVTKMLLFTHRQLQSTELQIEN